MATMGDPSVRRQTGAAALDQANCVDLPIESGSQLFLLEDSFGESMVKLQVREKESIQEAVRRFRKIVERSGIKKEMRRREFYEKPSEIKRRARLRAERRNERTLKPPR